MIEALVVVLRIGCVVVALHAIEQLRPMSTSTDHVQRAVYVAQCAGALGTACGIDYSIPILLAGLLAQVIIELLEWPPHG